ncbi:MAG TPA: hypothetical protein VHY35_24670 [Stellaceae bacterium]|nr:hypothetical protein [Stellaceae bacterium]
MVLGAGLSGLAISRALSAQGIGHVLVGTAPSDKPRLGESLNPDGSLEIVRQFPDQTRFFFDKRRVAVFFDGRTVDFDTLQLAAGRAMFAPLDYPSTVQLLHVDRVGFDRALHDAVVKDNHCLLAEGSIAEINYDPRTDRIDGIRLASGLSVACTYVFDATNHIRAAASRIGVPYQRIGDPRRVVFAHYRRNTSAAASAAPAEPRWTDATALVRLDRQNDVVDGLAWCIPLGDYVSLGISVDPATTSANPALLMDWVEKAYARRGIDILGVFGQRGTPTDQPYEHYTHERCHGRNWLLVGPTCCQIWFPAAAGVATGLIAARLAPDILRAPAQFAPLYQDYLDRVVASHSALAWLDEDSPQSATAEAVRQHAEAMLLGNTKRLSRYLGLKGTPPELAFGDALARFYEADRLLANPLHIDAATPGAQATRLFARGRGPWTGQPPGVTILQSLEKLEGPTAILGIVDMLSGRLEADTSSRFLADDVQLQIDQFRLHGTADWIAWVKILRNSADATNLQMMPASLAPGLLPPSPLPSGPLPPSPAQDHNDWVLTGQWQAEKNGRIAVSPPVSINFTLVGDRIAAIQTARADYTFIIGDSILPPVAFAAFVGQLNSGGTASTSQTPG